MVKSSLRVGGLAGGRVDSSLCVVWTGDALIQGNLYLRLLKEYIC